MRLEPAPIKFALLVVYAGDVAVNLAGTLLAESIFGLISRKKPSLDAIRKGGLMRVNSNMKVKECLKFNEHMIDAFVWLAPAFERLRNPVMRKAMAGHVSVERAARIAKVPLMEALYLLNLAAGEDEQKLTAELRLMNQEGRRYTPQDKERRPGEREGLSDNVLIDRSLTPKELSQ